MSSAVKAIIFDVNHTLIGIKDEERTQTAAVEVMFREVIRRTGRSFTFDDFSAAYTHAWQTGKRESFDEYRETRYENIVERTLHELGIDFDAEELEEVLQIYMEPLYRAAYLMAGVRDILESLKPHVKLGVITNYKYASGMTGLLRRTGLDEFLAASAVSSEVGWKKPAPAIYEAILERLATDAVECVLVGNELEKDLWQASRLGMKTVLYVTPEHGLHDVEFADLLRTRISDDELRCDYVASSSEELASVLRTLVWP